MRLTVNKQSALRLLRFARRQAGPRGLPATRTGLANPNPSPHGRWNANVLREAFAGWDKGFAEQPVQICVDSASRRLGSNAVKNTVYRDALPPGSFVPLNETISIACPELVFIEMGSALNIAAHLALGFELCGCYACDPLNPAQGKATFNLPAATSVEGIRRYLESCGPIPGKTQARRLLDYLADNAWSPMESAIATVISLPLEHHGYEMGRCMFNARVRASREYRAAFHRGSRVPDILIEGTRIGINYDGGYHLELKPLVDAAIEFGRNPASAANERHLREAESRVRARIIDDNRRNRELLTNGYLVFPVFKEDLYDANGFDTIMMQVLMALQRYEKWEDDGRLQLIAGRVAREERRALLSSLVPGPAYTLRGDSEEAIVSLKLRQSKRL